MNVIPETAPERRHTFYFRQSDVDMLRWLAEYHYLQPLHFEKLSGGRNIVSIRRRLRQLYEQKYVERLTLPLERQRPIGSPPDQYVYYLSGRGMNLARQYGFADGNFRHNPEKKVTLLAHDVLISTFHLALELATRAHPEVEILYWEQRRSALQDSVERGRAQLSVNPDALLGIRNATKPPDRNTAYFFLEMVRVRESDYQKEESYFMRKMRGFQAYAEQGRHEKQFGIGNFRVLTILPTQARALNLCRKMNDVDLGSRRFWFSDFASYSLEEPEKILGKIFLSPKDYEEGTLYSFLD